MLSKKINGSVAVLALSCALPFSANASNDGKLCEGFPNAIICAPFQLGLVVADRLSPSHRMNEAIEAGDLKKVKPLLGSTTQVSPEDTLYTAAKSYLGPGDSATTERKFKIIEYILTNYQVDMTGWRGNSLLELTLWDPIYIKESDKRINQRIRLAKILTAHGARGDKLDLSQCARCDLNMELLTVLIRGGANRSTVGPLAQYLPPVDDTQGK